MSFKKFSYGKIPDNWDVKKVKDYTKTVTDYVANGSFASLKKNVTYYAEPNYAVLLRLVDYNKNFTGDFVFIDENAYNFLSKTKLYGGEIIISNVGANVGTVFRAPKLKYKMNLGPNAIMVKTKGDDAFFYYWFSSPNGQSSIKSILSGSAQPKFNKTSFRNLEIPVPSLEEQKTIAHILSTLDEKIEVNNRINKVLEKMAQTIFKHWFIDFEFPNENGEPYKSSGGEMVESELGMIPKGWEVKSLDEIADYLNGLAMQKYRPKENEESYPVLKIKELRQGRTDLNSDICSKNIDEKYVVIDGDVIFSWSGSLLVDFWCGGKCGLNQHLFKVTSNKYEKWFYFLWTKYHLDRFIRIAESKATTMGHIKRKDLKDSKVIVPDETIYNKANTILKPLFYKIITSKIESRKLEKIRDTLLPKLMSGEIRVPIDN